MTPCETSCLTQLYWHHRESNGVGGKIHCSEETAIELKRRGKAMWVMMREDKILAKGKGELQTYWVLPRNIASSTNSRTNTLLTDTTTDHARTEQQQSRYEEENSEEMSRRLERWATRK